MMTMVSMVAKIGEEGVEQAPGERENFMKNGGTTIETIEDRRIGEWIETEIIEVGEIGTGGGGRTSNRSG